MATIPPNNNTGLYGIDGSTVAVDNNITTGNITATGNLAVGGNATVVGSVTANSFIGNGAQLTNINAANVSGNIANAVHADFADVANSVTGGNVTGQVANALVAGTVYTAAQPAITSVGTLTSLTVTGNVTAASFNTANGSISGGNIAAGNVSASGVITAVGTVTGGNLTTAGNVTGANINGGNIFANNATITNATQTGTLTADGNITGALLQTVGAQGNIVGANFVNANFFVGDGSLLTNLPAGTYGNAEVSDYLASGTNTANVVTTGNISGSYILGNGAFLTGVAASYGDSNVTTLLASFGSNTVSTTGNVTAGNIVANGQALTNLPAANIVGTVANATYAVSAGTATVADSANSVAGANVTGTVASATQAATANVANSVSGANVTGTVASATQANTANVANSVSGANVTGTVASATQATVADTANAVAGGNVTGQVANALVAGTVYTNAQPNITSVGTLSSLSVTGNVDGGNLNIGQDAYITGDVYAGTYYGTFAGNISGNLVVPGSNTWVIYNNNGNAGADSDFVFNSDTSAVTVTGNITGGNLITAGNVSGSYIFGNGSQLTGLPATYSDSNVTTLLASFGSNSISTTGNITAGLFTGSGAGLSSLTGANITGTVANATYAVDAGHATVADSANAVAGANVTGTVANATFATSAASATTAATVTTNAQPNITSVGTLSSLSVTGNIGTGGILTDGYYYANGTPVTFGGGGTYGDSNVTTLLSSFGSNTITTTGNVSAGNLAVTGANAQLVMAGSTSNKINFGTTGYGPPTVGTYSNGAKVVLYDSISNTNAGYAIGIDSYTMWFNTDIPGSNFEYYVGNAKVATIEANGSITANTVTYTGTDGTAGQVLTTHGNGQTYFSTVSGGSGSPGGSDGQIQYNNGGAFGGNVAMTFDDATGNITLGNIIVELDQQMQTVSAYSGNSSVRNPGQITVGNGYDGNISNSTYLTASARGSRLISYDKYVKVDNGSRNSQLSSLSYVDLNGSTTFGASNVNSRILGISSDTMIINGNTVGITGSVNQIRGTATTVYAGVGANVGNANIASLTSVYSFVQPYAGSSIGNAWSYMADSGGGGTTAPLNTWLGFAIKPGHTANTTTGNIFGVYMPGTTATYGASMSNNQRQAANYYFLRCDDDAAQTKLGSLRSYNEYRYDVSSSSGTLTIDKNNAQVQYIDVTENITTVAFSNFYIGTEINSVAKFAMDTVTLVFRQGATPYTITMPTGAGYKYAAGASTMGSTANTVQMVSVSAIYSADLDDIEYLITISPEFS